MKSIRVVNLTLAAGKLVPRLHANPSGLPVKVGWDGQQIAVFSGAVAGPTKSLPHARIVLDPWMGTEEIEIALATAAADLLRSLPQALADHRSARRPRQAHHWRRGGIARSPGGE